MHLPYENERIEIRASKIVCVGKNYEAHAREMRSEIPREPVIFLKPPSSLLPPDSTIIIPPESREVEHEVELAVIVKKRAKKVPIDSAMDYILGYTVFLDMTARDIQREAKRRGLPWTVSKGFDTFAPIGPRIVDAGNISPHNLEISLHVNGEIRQHGNTSAMIFKVPELIAYISSIMTLEPGDIIATGTPSGVGPVHDGAVIEAKIDGIGTLRENVERN